MTANKDLKKRIRTRMRKTGESYTAARRHFLRSEEAEMTKQSATATSPLDSSIDHLELTLRTARVLKQHDICTIGELVGKTENELAEIGLTGQRWIEIKEVLASRGL